MNNLSSKITAFCLSVLAVLHGMLATHAPTTMLASSSRSRRAATFIEYAILASIAIIVGGLLSGALQSFIKGIFGHLSGVFN